MTTMDDGIDRFAIRMRMRDDTMSCDRAERSRWNGLLQERETHHRIHVGQGADDNGRLRDVLLHGDALHYHVVLANARGPRGNDGVPEHVVRSRVCRGCPRTGPHRRVMAVMAALLTSTTLSTESSSSARQSATDGGSSAAGMRAGCELLTAEDGKVGAAEVSAGHQRLQRRVAPRQNARLPGQRTRAWKGSGNGSAASRTAQ
jgi:hypothetical protein